LRGSKGEKKALDRGKGFAFQTVLTVQVEENIPAPRATAELVDFETTSELRRKVGQIGNRRCPVTG
jgi:hypothetical protein